MKKPESNLNNDFYVMGAHYFHNRTEYIAEYIGKERNRHTYEVIEASEKSGFKKGDKFTPQEPQRYFSIL